MPSHAPRRPNPHPPPNHPHPVTLLYKLIQLLHHLPTYQAQHNGHLTKAFESKTKHLGDFVKPPSSDSNIQEELARAHRSWATNIGATLAKHCTTKLTALQNQILALNIKQTLIDEFAHKAITRAKANYGRKLARQTLDEFRSICSKLSQGNNANHRQNQPRHPASTGPPPGFIRPLMTKLFDRPPTTQHAHNQAPQTRQHHTPTRQPVLSTPHNQKRYKSMSDSRYVMGPSDPLSNFWLCHFQYQGESYRSLEHCYQSVKAWLHGHYDLAYEIAAQRTAAGAKQLSKNIKLSPQWFRERGKLMFTLLNLKYQQILPFRQELNAVQGRDIIHPVPDPFWGSGKDRKGEDMFSFLLRTVLRSHTRPPPAPPKRKPTLNTRKPILPTSDPLTTTNRFAVLNQESTPTLSPQPSTSRTSSKKHTSRPRNSTPTSPPSTSSHQSPKPTSKQAPTSPHLASPSSIFTEDDFPVVIPPLVQPPQTPPTSKPTQSSLVPSTPSKRPHSPSTSASSPPAKRQILTKSSTTRRRHSSQPTPTAPNSLTTCTPTKRPHSSQTAATSPCRSPPAKRQTLRPIELNTKFQITPTVYKSNKSKPKSTWQWPKTNRPIVIIGDSNIARISRGPSDQIEAHSYAGANFRNMYDMLSSFEMPSTAPEHLIISLGINNRDTGWQTTSFKNIKSLNHKLHQLYPSTTKIHWVELNHSPRLTSNQKANISKMNDTFKKWSFIPQIRESQFKIDKGDTLHIHWSNETANYLLNHWFFSIPALN